MLCDTETRGYEVVLPRRSFEYKLACAGRHQMSDDMTDASIASQQAGNRLPLWLKLAHTGFMAVLVPVYP
jgi:hypothetical protein